MSLIGFRREENEIEYLEQVEYSVEHIEDDLHEVIRNEPRLVMGNLTTRENVVLGSKLQLPTGKELDLLTCDKRGTLTIIEFKRDRSPRSAVTQLFDYASSLERLDLNEFLNLVGHNSVEEFYGMFEREEESEYGMNDFERTLSDGLESPQMMLVAYTITDDVRRMTRWLRDIHELKINCVEFDYYKRDDAEMFVPTVIGIDETQEIKDKQSLRGKKEYLRFYEEILERFKEELPNVTRRSPSRDSWLAIPTGHKDVELVWAFKGVPGEKKFRVEMNFKLDDLAQNRELLKAELETLKDSPIEIAEEIHNEGQYGSSGYTRFYVERDVGELGDALDDEKLKSWAVGTMVGLHENLTPVSEDELL